MRRLLVDLFIKFLLTALFGWVMFGVAGRIDTWLAWGALILWLLIGLGKEWFRKPLTVAGWEQTRQQVAKKWSARAEVWKTEEEEPDEEPRAKQGFPQVNPAAMIAREMERLKAAYMPPRPRMMLAAECLGLIGFLVLLPFVTGLERNEFFSFRRGYSMMEVLVLIVCVGLYFAPRLPLARDQPAAMKWVWWAGAFVCLVPAAVELVQTKHPYLNPWLPEHTRLAAEKVLAMRDSVVASVHADWVVDYAREQAQAGHIAEAKALCEKALRLKPGMGEAMTLLKQLGGALDQKLAVNPHAPYFQPGEVVPRARRCLLNADLEKVPACTVIIMPMGTVADDVLDYVAAVITKETNVPSAVYERTLPLPEPTRIHGLAYGRQWEAGELLKRFQKELSAPLPRAPLKFLVLTAADMYAGDANYLFSVTFQFGALVSSARYEEVKGTHAEMCHRFAKQALGAIIKSFGTEASPDPRCVTSYTASLDEFDRKGNHPVPTTLDRLNEKLRAINVPWQRYRAFQVR